MDGNFARSLELFECLLQERGGVVIRIATFHVEGYGGSENRDVGFFALFLCGEEILIMKGADKYGEG